MPTMRVTLTASVAAASDRPLGGGHRVLRAHPLVPREDARRRPSGEAGIRTAIAAGNDFIRAAATAGVAWMEAPAPRGENVGQFTTMFFVLVRKAKGGFVVSLPEEDGNDSGRHVALQHLHGGRLSSAQKRFL